MPPAEAPMPTTGTPAFSRGGSGSSLFLLVAIGRDCLLSPIRCRPGPRLTAALQRSHDLDVVVVVARPALEMLSQHVPLVHPLVLGHAVRQRRAFLVRAQEGPQQPVDFLAL